MDPRPERAARRRGRLRRPIASVGVDTWGVDFGLLGRGDELLGNPYHYRDSRTNGMLEKAFAIVPREEIFRHTGLQFMQFNTLYQLLAMKLADSPLLDVAETLLMVPDLFHWLMTGVKCNEIHRGQHQPVLQSGQGRLGHRIARASSACRRAFSGRIAQPGTNLGPLRPNVAAETGLTADVVLPGSHDTASAVMAVPAASRPGQRPDWCYISLGTWALMGIESPQPVVNDKVLELNFTNEGGVGDTIRAAEEHLRAVAGAGVPPGVEPGGPRTGVGRTSTGCRRPAKPLVSFIDPDAADFLAPDDMPEAIRGFCRRTGQTVPEDEGRRAALRPGQHRDEVPPGAGHVRGAGRRADRDDPHRRRRHAEPAALPGRGRRLRPPRGGRPDRGHGHRQRDDAGRCRRRRRLASPRPARSSAAASRSTQYEPHDTAAWDEAYDKFLGNQRGRTMMNVGIAGFGFMGMIHYLAYREDARGEGRGDLREGSRSPGGRLAVDQGEFRPAGQEDGPRRRGALRRTGRLAGRSEDRHDRHLPAARRCTPRRPSGA